MTHMEYPSFIWRGYADICFAKMILAFSILVFITSCATKKSFIHCRWSSHKQSYSVPSVEEVLQRCQLLLWFNFQNNRTGSSLPSFADQSTRHLCWLQLQFEFQISPVTFFYFTWKLKLRFLYTRTCIFFQNLRDTGGLVVYIIISLVSVHQVWAGVPPPARGHTKHTGIILFL